MPDYLRLTERLDCLDMAWAICASLILHILLVLILARTSSYVPFFGPVPVFDLIWATPSSAPADVAVTEQVSPPGPPEIQQATTITDKSSWGEPTSAPPSITRLAALDSGDLTVADAPAVSLVSRKEIAPREKPSDAPKETTPPGKAEEPEKKRHDVKDEPAPGPTESDDLKPEQERLGAEQEEDNRETAQRERLEQIERENAERERVAEKARLSREQEERKRQADRQALLEKSERKKGERDRISAQESETARKVAAPAEKKPEQAQLAAVQPPLRRERTITGSQEVAHPQQPEARPAQNLPAPLPAGRVAKVAEKQAITSLKPTEPAKERVAKPSKEPQETRGLIMAAKRGDLKLVIKGDNGIKLSIKFRAYPKSRRNKVLTRSEARRVETIVPILTQTRESTREAVVEIAREGVYLFSVESKEEKGARASFTLKVFESGSREKIAELGSRTISGKTILEKILMPDAIRWDEESAFTGSLEDSESVTKFNVGTGLYWKEFNVLEP